MTMSPETKRMNSETTWVANLLSFLLPLVKGWRWIIGLTFLGGLLGIGLALVLPESFQAKATLLLTESKSSAGGSLAKLAGGDLGSLLTMNDNSSKDELSVILGTDTLAMRTIQQFHLVRVWKMDTTKELRREKILKGWGKAFAFEFGEEDQLVVSFVDADPKFARDVLVAHIGRIDSAWIALKRDEATKKARFVEERVDERMALFQSRMDSLIRFQIDNRIYDPGEQIRATVEALSELESKITGAKMSSEYSKRVDGGSKVGALNELTSILQEDADRLIGAGGAKSTAGTGLLMNLRKALPLSAEYQKKLRLLQLDAVVVEGLSRQVEQLKIESLRNVSVLQMVDPPVPPQQRRSPPRTAMVELITALSFALSCCLAYAIEFFRRSPRERSMLREVLRAWR